MALRCPLFPVTSNPHPWPPASSIVAANAQMLTPNWLESLTGHLAQKSWSTQAAHPQEAGPNPVSLGHAHWGHSHRILGDGDVDMCSSASTNLRNGLRHMFPIFDTTSGRNKRRACLLVPLLLKSLCFTYTSSVYGYMLPSPVGFGWLFKAITELFTHSCDGTSFSWWPGLGTPAGHQSSHPESDKSTRSPQLRPLLLL